MKRIILFINSLSSGGAERQLCELASGLAERGYDVTITTYADMEEQYSYSPLVKRYHIAPERSSAIKLLSIWYYFLSLKTDCVIAFCQRNIRFCMEALQFRSRKGIRIIASERNFTVNKPTNHEKALMNRLYKYVDYIVPNNHAQHNHIVELKPEYESKTITIINYTDINFFAPSPLPNNSPLRIGVFGRYDIQKNCLRFVEAVRLLKEEATVPFQIDWYGNQSLKDKSPNPFYLDMKSKIKEYNLQDQLILHNHVKDVASEICLFDAICLPSLWEGFSNSISEAICSGRPCLVSDVADNHVMVEDGVNGFLFNPNVTGDIASAFLKFLTLGQSERQRMGNASRKRAEELFDREKFIQQYIDLIES